MPSSATVFLWLCTLILSVPDEPTAALSPVLTSIPVEDLGLPVLEDLAELQFSRRTLESKLLTCYAHPNLG